MARLAVLTELVFVDVIVAVGAFTKLQGFKCCHSSERWIWLVTISARHFFVKSLKLVIDFVMIEFHGLCHALPVFNSAGVALSTHKPILVLELMLIDVVVTLVASGLGIEIAFGLRLLLCFEMRSVGVMTVSALNLFVSSKQFIVSL